LAARIYTDKGANLRWLKGKTCAVSAPNEWLGAQKYKAPSALPSRQRRITGEIVRGFDYLPV